jgi:hypothetical protein
MNSNRIVTYYGNTYIPLGTQRNHIVDSNPDELAIENSHNLNKQVKHKQFVLEKIKVSLSYSKKAGS